MFVFLIRHRGHGHAPMSRTVARSTLEQSRSQSIAIGGNARISLLRIVCGVSEDSRENPTNHTISAAHDKPMLICFEELVVEDGADSSMHKLASTMRDDWRSST